MNKKAIAFILISGLLLLVGIGVGFNIYQKSKFRLLQTSPETVLPTSVSEIVYSFNRELAPVDLQAGVASTEPQIDHTVTVSGQDLILHIKQPLDQDTALRVVLTGLKAIDGDELNVESEFNIRYVEFDKLSKAIQDRMIDSSSVAGDNHPLLSLLPRDEISFKVTAIIDSNYGLEDDWRKEKNNYKIVIQTFTTNYGIAPEAHKQKHLVIRQNALDWIQSLGVSPVDINIVYFPSDAELDQVAEEFPGE